MKLSWLIKALEDIKARDGDIQIKPAIQLEIIGESIKYLLVKSELPIYEPRTNQEAS